MWLQHPISHVLWKKRPYIVATYFSTQDDILTTWTFGTATLGHPGEGRKLIIAAMGFEQTTNFSIASVSVDGVAATEVVDSASTTSLVQSALYIKDHPGGTSASIAITFSEQIEGSAGLYVWCAYNLTSSTAVATATQFQTTSAAITLSVGCPNNGIVVAASNCASAAQTATWTGLQSTASTAAATGAYSVGWTPNANNYSPSLGITADWTGTSDSIGVAASFR